MILLQTLLAFFVALGILVTVHEFGHYLAARICGVKVLRFSIGMGKVVYSCKLGQDQTEWAISILPLGGYVKMLDVREQGNVTIAESEMRREFCSQSVWKRIFIVLAGPLANFLLAIFLYSSLYVYGIPEPIAKIRAPSLGSIAYQSGLRQGDLIKSVNGKAVLGWSDVRWSLMQAALEKAPIHIEVERRNEQNPSTKRLSLALTTNEFNATEVAGDFLAKLGISLAVPPAYLGRILEGGPAMAAGLQQGDRILEVNQQIIADGMEFIETVSASAGKPLELLVQRNLRKFEVTVTPAVEKNNGKVIGRLKVEMSLSPEMTIVRAPIINAVRKAAERTWSTSVLSLKMLARMITGEVSLKNITGPLTIADYAGQTSRMGAVSYIAFIAFISISLGIMNLLPIPVLDGGHLLYYSLEVLTGKPVPERFAEMAQRTGFAVLIALMAIAFFNDIVRLMS